MSGNKRDSKSKSNEGGLGLGAAVLLGAGAATVGFLARDLWNSYQETSGSSGAAGVGSSTSPPTSNTTRSSDWEHKSDEKLGARRKQREAFGDQNMPDEMKCIACIDNPREVCFIPCGHVCVCEDCAEKIGKNCPMCSQLIENKKVVYI